MKKYAAVVIDDEDKLREVLMMKLKSHCPEVEILGQAGNADEGIAEIERCKPDLIFLDIAMPRGSGFDMLKRIEMVDFEVIFVTGYNDYALQALRISAVDYLLKPVIDDELIEAVNKAIERIEGRSIIADYKLLQHNIVHQKDQRAKLSLPGVNAYEQIEISDIIRCEGEQRYTRVYLKDEKSILSSYSIGVFKELLSDYDFFVTHKSHLVNTFHINRYQKEGLVLMSDGSSVPVARRKREEFKVKVLQINTKGRDSLN